MYIKNMLFLAVSSRKLNVPHRITRRYSIVQQDSVNLALKPSNYVKFLLLCEPRRSAKMILAMHRKWSVLACLISNLAPFA